MYSKDVKMGRQGITVVRGAYKRTFEGKASHRSEVDPYAYLEAHSGKYDEKEKTIINDLYVDGWAWFIAGKPLSKFKPSKWISAKAKEENMRLFKMGFKDAKELA